MPTTELLRALLRYVRPYRAAVVVVALGGLLEMSFAAALPFSFKYIVDRGLVGGDHSLLIAILVTLALGAVVVSAIGVGRDYLYARVASTVWGDIAEHMFGKLQRLSMDFFRRTSTGDILARFSVDLDAIDVAMSGALASAFLPAIEIVLTTALLFVLDWRLALVAMLVWPLALVGPRVFGSRALAASFERKVVEGRTLHAVQENVAAQQVVKALGIERDAARAFRERNVELTRSVLRVSFLSSLAERSAGVAVTLLQVTVLGVGAWMASDDRLSVGTLVSFQALFLALSQSLAKLTRYVPTLVHAGGAFRHVRALLEEDPAVSDAPGAAALRPVDGEIHLDHVTFGYDPARPVLHDLDITIRAGSSVAFVGASGSGKSTVLGLVMRLQDPQKGAVRFDGRDLRDATQASVRSQLGVVFQDSFLFDATVADNIRVARPEATTAEVEAAARAAEIHDDIERLPAGYATRVGERGAHLSGGQRQRIAIARAILRDPRVLLLDEAGSALDPGTEAAVNATLERVGRRRTVIAVTHRLASVTQADCIHVLDGGVLVESGRHEELLARGGVYHRLWAKQSGFHVNAQGDHATIDAARLRALPVLGHLDEALLGEVARLFVTEQYPAGRTVIYEGEVGDRFYLIVRGSVEVRKEADGAERRSVMEDGDFFGEIALLQSTPRTASVRTLTPCTFLTLQRDQFAYVLERAPHLRDHLEAVHAQRVAVEDALGSVASSAVRESRGS